MHQLRLSSLHGFFTRFSFPPEGNDSKKVKAANKCAFVENKYQGLLLGDDINLLHVRAYGSCSLAVAHKKLIGLFSAHEKRFTAKIRLMI